MNNYYSMVPGLRLRAGREMSLRSKVHFGHAKHFGKTQALSLSWGKDAPGASSLSAGGKEVALRGTHHLPFGEAQPRRAGRAGIEVVAQTAPRARGSACTWQQSRHNSCLRDRLWGLFLSRPGG